MWTLTTTGQEPHSSRTFWSQPLFPCPILISQAFWIWRPAFDTQQLCYYQEPTGNNERGLSQATAVLRFQRKSLIKGCFVTFVTFLSGDYRLFIGEDSAAICGWCAPQISSESFGYVVSNLHFSQQFPRFSHPNLQNKSLYFQQNLFVLIRRSHQRQFRDKLSYLKMQTPWYLVCDLL